MNTPPTAEQLIASLRSDLCPGCAGRKGPKKTFCSKCFFSLRPGLRQDLYKRVGEGYEEAFEAAMVQLNLVAPHLPPHVPDDAEDYE